MISVEEATARIASAFRPVEAETIAIGDAAGLKLVQLVSGGDVARDQVGAFIR